MKHPQDVFIPGRISLVFFKTDPMAGWPDCEVQLELSF